MGLKWRWVTGVGAIVQAGERLAELGAHGALEHPANPAGDVVLPGQRHDLQRHRCASASARLDVKDLAAVELHCRLRGAQRVEALVEADRRLEHLGELLLAES